MFWKWLENNTGKALGLLAGLILGIVYLIFGFFDTLVFFLIVSAGLYVGNKLDKKEDLAEVLDRILPGKYTKS